MGFLNNEFNEFLFAETLEDFFVGIEGKWLGHLVEVVVSLEVECVR